MSCDHVQQAYNATAVIRQMRKLAMCSTAGAPVSVHPPSLYSTPSACVNPSSECSPSTTKSKRATSHCTK